MISGDLTKAPGWYLALIEENGCKNRLQENITTLAAPIGKDLGLGSPLWLQWEPQKLTVGVEA